MANPNSTGGLTDQLASDASCGAAEDIILKRLSDSLALLLLSRLKKFQFWKANNGIQARPVPGTYTFVMLLVCDSRMGFDERGVIKLVVEDCEKDVDIESEKISEPAKGTSFSVLLLFPYGSLYSLLLWGSLGSCVGSFLLRRGFHRRRD